MNLLRETAILLGNTAIVTIAVILGFTVCGVIGVPGWLQGFSLIPAGWLFYRLSGGATPVCWKWVSLLAVLSGLTFIFTVVFPHVPQHYQAAAFMLLAMFWPSVTRWIGRRFDKTP